MTEKSLTLRMRAIGELEGAARWLQLLQQGKQALSELRQELKLYNAEVARGQGGTPGGGNAPPGTPVPPRPPTGGSGGVPPVGPVPPMRPPGMGGAAPPPPPAPVPGGAGGVQNVVLHAQHVIINAQTVQGPGGGRGGARSEPGGGAPPAPTGSDAAEQAREEKDDLVLPEPEKGGGGWKGRMARGAMSAAQGAAQVGKIAMGVALGGSLVGLFTSSAETYMRNSRAMAQMGQRFRGYGNPAGWGGGYGYTIGETAGVAGTYGAQVDRFDRRSMSRVLGFARYTGLDANEAATRVGSLTQLAGRELSDRDFALIMARAQAQGMSRGRLSEFMGVFGAMGEAQFNRTGRADIGSIQALMAVPGLAFGFDSERARGRSALDLTQRMQAGFDSPATQTFLLRSMGYGTPGGPGYIEMRKRLDAGAYDPRNLRDVIGGIGKMGLSMTHRFQALEGAFPQLRAHEIEAMAQMMGDPEKMAKLEELAKGGDVGALKEFFGQEGVDSFDPAKLGRGKAGIGEAAAVQLEQIQMTLGGPVVKGIMGARDVLVNLAQSFGNLTGLDWGNLTGGFDKLVNATVKISEKIEEGTRPGGGIRDVITIPGNFLMDVYEESTGTASGTKGAEIYNKAVSNPALMYGLGQITPVFMFLPTTDTIRDTRAWLRNEGGSGGNQ